MVPFSGSKHRTTLHTNCSRPLTVPKSAISSHFHPALTAPTTCTTFPLPSRPEKYPKEHPLDAIASKKPFQANCPHDPSLPPLEMSGGLKPCPQIAQTSNW